MSKVTILGHLSDNFDEFYDRLKKSATANVAEKLKEKDDNLIDAWVIDTPEGGYLVHETEGTHGDKELRIARYYNHPDKDFLSKKISKDVDIYAEGVLGVSDDIYEYGYRPSKEKLLQESTIGQCFINMVLVSKQELSPVKMELLKKIIAGEIDEEKEKQIQEILSERESPENPSYRIENHFSNVIIDPELLLDFVNAINFNPRDMFEDLEVDALEQIQYLKVYGKQICRILKDKDYNKDKKFVFNDLDNSAYYCGEKEGFEMYAVTCQNTKIMVYQSDQDFIAVPFEGAVDIVESKWERIEDIIKSGITSGSYMSTTDNSPNFLPTFDYLVNSNIEDIKNLKSVCICAEGCEVSKISPYFEALSMNMGFTQLYLTEEVGEDCDMRYPKDGSYSQLARAMNYQGGFTSVPLRHYLFWTLGNEFEWHKDGHLHKPNMEMKVNPEVEVIPDGGKSRFSYGAFGRDIPILNIPDNVRPDFLTQIKESIEDARHYCELHPDDEKSIVLLDKVEKYVKSFEAKRRKTMKLR